MPTAARIQMTDEQRAICDCTDARILVEANAGAGKTTTAAMKIARLVSEGVDPAKILALSFKEPGVRAYRDAFARLGIPDRTARAVRVGTFDDFCASRLKWLEGAEVERLTRPEQVRPFVLAAIAQAREWAQARYPGEFSVAGSGEIAVEGLLDEFDHLKGTMQLVHEAEHFQLSPAGADALGRDFTALAIYRFYEEQRCRFFDPQGERTRYRFSGDAAHDLACALVSDDPPFVEKEHPLRRGIEAIVLDEMHDTNRAMFTVLQHLLEQNEGVRFLGVGDRDQVIHARHGADSYFMGEGFDRIIGPSTRLPLGRSFRFGPALAGPLAVFAGKAYPAAPEIPSRVLLRSSDSATDLLAILQRVLSDRRRSRADAPNSQVALLLRHPSEAAELEHELRRTAMPYETVGFTTYLQRPEVLFVRLLLTAAVDLQEQLSARVLADAKRAVWAFVGGTLQTPDDAEDPTGAYIDSAPQPNFFKWVLPRLLETTSDRRASQRLRAAMRLASSDRVGDLAASLKELDVNGLARHVFVDRQAADDAEASIDGLARAGQQYGSISSFLKSLISHDYDAYAGKLARERIVLSSIEAAKGLEFECVIVPDVNRGGFDGGKADDHNLFYVAASRARQLLVLTHRPGQASAYLRPYATD